MMTIETIADLQARCEALAKKLGPKAQARVTLGSGSAFLIIEPIRTSSHEYKLFYPNVTAGEGSGGGWDVAFMQAEVWADEWMAKRVVPVSWFDDEAFGAAA
jgi:hypothetical protein